MAKLLVQPVVANVAEVITAIVTPAVQYLQLLQQLWKFDPITTTDITCVLIFMMSVMQEVALYLLRQSLWQLFQQQF